MNINFKINKEEENVIVSNENGKMEKREYQDNILDILKLEDIIEEQQIDLSRLDKKKKEKKSRIKEQEKEIQKSYRTWELFKKGFIGMLIGCPIFMVFVSLVCELISSTSPEIIIELRHIINGLVAGGISDAIVIVVSTLYVFSEDFPLTCIKQLEIEKKENELSLQEQELEIHLLEQMISKNEKQLEYLEEQKEKKNLEMVPEKVQNISYYEELELQRCYLIEMYEANKSSITNPKKQEVKETILGRFRKKKIN